MRRLGLLEAESERRRRRKWKERHGRKRKGMEEEKKRKKWSVKKAQSAGKDVKLNKYIGGKRDPT